MATPYPRGWISSGNHAAFWGSARGTYQLIDADRLPPLAAGDDAFAWLTPLADPHDEPLSYAGHTHDGDGHGAPEDHEREHRAEGLLHLGRAHAEAIRLGLRIPDAALRFLRDPMLYARVPTNTACYLDVSHELLVPPGGLPGRLLRFLTDQQVVVCWYLHLRPDGGHSVVVAEPEPRDAPRDDAHRLDELVTIGEPLECSADFMDFVRRFWIENTIWYALTYGRALTPEQQAYLRHVVG